MGWWWNTIAGWISVAGWTIGADVETDKLQVDAAAVEKDTEIVHIEVICRA